MTNSRLAANNSARSSMGKFNLLRVADLADPLYQLQAGCYAAQIQLLETQIATVERALYPHLIPTRMSSSCSGSRDAGR